MDTQQNNQHSLLWWTRRVLALRKRWKVFGLGTLEFLQPENRKALAFIRELEGVNRGRYAGPVGWVDARGDGEWAIALRCAELSGTAARLFAGAGIVSGSDPVAELEEARLKLRPVRSALNLS